MSKSNYQQRVEEVLSKTGAAIATGVVTGKWEKQDTVQALTQLIEEQYAQGYIDGQKVEQEKHPHFAKTFEQDRNQAIAEELENALLSSNPNYIADRLKELKGGEHESKL